MRDEFSGDNRSDWSAHNIFKTMRRIAEEREAMVEENTKTMALNCLDEDYYAGEIVSETLPYSDNWAFIRAELKKHIEGTGCNYEALGIILAEEATDYVLNECKTNVLDRL